MKTALVTGGTVRIGLAIAECLRSQGWRVLTSSHRPGAGADITVDLSGELGAAKLYAAALSILGGRPPDALVNNAAVYSGDGAEIEAVNLAAPKKLTMMMASREEGMGAVVNVLDSPAAGVAPARRPGAEAYVRTKGELRKYTVEAAAMFSATLRVNAVAPGPVLAPVGFREKAGETPVGRPSADDVAEAVAYLLSAKSTTGCVIPVDGGLHLL